MPSQYSHLINGQWIEGDGPALTTIDPATGNPVWSGHMATAAEVDRACNAARASFKGWARTALDEARISGKAASEDPALILRCRAGALAA